MYHHRLTTTLCTILIFVSGLALAVDEDGFIGPNRLRGNDAVSVYRENDRGVTTYVEGRLSDPIAPGNELEALAAFFEEHRAAFRMTNPAEEIIPYRIDHDDLGFRHVRLRQDYRGLRVIGGELIAHFTRDGILKTVNGNFVSDISLDPTPAVDAVEATATARADLLVFFGDGTPDEPELVVFPWEGKHYLCWRLFLFSETPMGRWEYLVDARTGDVVYKANRIMNENDIGTGIGVMGDPRDHIDTDFNSNTYRMIDYTRQLNNNPHGHDGQMPDGNYIQTNYASSSLPGSVATDADNVWDAGGTQAPAVDGQVYSGLFYDWVLREFNRNSYDDVGHSMLTSVNYSAEGDNNAYWNGSQIVVWSWSSGWRSLAGCPDVIAHEWGHAVTEYTSGLIYEKEPGALNESFSDMMGAAFEFAHDTMDVPDWLMGENGQISGNGFRDMENPHDFGDPDFYGPTDPYWVDVINCTPSWLNDYCGVHTNSGVGNKWFSLLSDGGTHHSVTVTGVGVNNAIKIAYRANAFYWTSASDYHQAAEGTISAALDLDSTGAWATQAAAAWNAVGVATPGPSLVFTYPNGVPTILAPEQATSFAVTVSGVLGGQPVPATGMLYYSVDGRQYTSVPMIVTGPNEYQATLPAMNCDRHVRFYVSAEESASGVNYDPDTSRPFTAVVATGSSVTMSDNFETDLGWTVSGDATDGQWTRGVPVGGGDRGDPPTDYDGSGSCYLTDNEDGNSDVDGGTTSLTSPLFDATTGPTRISFALWYSNNNGSAPYEDSFEIYISNDSGGSWTLAETVGPVEQASGGWFEHSLWVEDHVTASSQMFMRFDASDLGSGSVVEAALDAFEITVYECESSAAPQIVTGDLPDWTVNQPYSVQLTASGGTGQLTWSDLNGDLVVWGLSLSAGGLVSGTPTQIGTVTFTAQVTDENNNSDQQLYSFEINDSLAITTTSLPDWTMGHVYSQQLQSSGGTSPTTWSDLNDDLVGSGLSLTADGEVTGTPVIATTISFTAEVTDVAGDSETQPYTFTINPPVTITTASLPDWTQGYPYSQQLTGTGGTGATSWSDLDGDLAGTGLALSAAGLVSGTPTSTGPVTFTAELTDAVGATDTQEYTFTINPAVSITTTTLPEWTVGQAYSQQLAGTGGSGPVTWADLNGDLAGSGLSLSASGLLSGTPTITPSITFTAELTDSLGASDTQELSVTINDAVSITTDSLPPGQRDSAYSYLLEATGGTGTRTWTEMGTALNDAGLNLASDGQITGAPIDTGVISFTARLQDATGSTDEQSFDLEVTLAYICGDADWDFDGPNVADLSYLVSFLFLDGPPPVYEPAANIDGLTQFGEAVDVADLSYLVEYLFLEGPEPICEP